MDALIDSHGENRWSDPTVQGRWLKAVVKREDHYQDVAKVISTEVEPAVPKGDNYLSQMTRVKMMIDLGSGVVVRKSVIVKRIPDGEKVRQIIEGNAAFKMEIHNYKEVFPLMENVMAASGDTTDKLWCECYDVTPYSQLVLEDLKDSGYRMADRKVGLDLDQALLAVKGLAKFHALSYVLIERGELHVKRYRDCYLGCATTHMDALIRGGIRTLVQVMKSSWEPEWHSVGDKLAFLGPTLSEQMKDLIVGHQPQFRVLNHGDAWINNIMFKYDSTTGRPISIRFVDYQMSNYNTPALELIYFIYSSLRQSVKQCHRAEIISTYCRSLRDNFRKYRPAGPPQHLPSEEVLETDLDRLTLVGLVVTCTFKPIMVAGSDHAMDIENLTTEDGADNGQTHDPVVFMNKEVEAMLKHDLANFISKGHL